MELETITQEIINTPEDESSDYEDQVFIRSVIGDYYCNRVDTVSSEEEKRDCLLKASRFYNDGSILCKEALDYKNAFTILIGIKLACYLV